MANIFVKQPIRINKLSPAGELEDVWLFIGKVPKDVQAALQKIEKFGYDKAAASSTTRSPLKKFYGRNWVDILGFREHGKHGGAQSAKTKEEKNKESDLDSEPAAEPVDEPMLEVAERTDFDDAVDELSQIQGLEFTLDDIKDIDKPIATKPEAAATGMPPGSRRHRRRAQIPPGGRIHMVFDDCIFPEHSVISLKQKLYALSGIPIYRQHIWFKTNPLQYTISMFWHKINIRPIVPLPDTGETIMGIPIVTEYYESRHDILIEARDAFELMQSYYFRYGVTIFNMVDLADYIMEPETILKNRSQLEWIYYGFIILYWPMVTMPVFIQWLTDPASIANLYPELEPPVRVINNRSALETDILNTRYEIVDQKGLRPSKAVPKLKVSITYSIITVTNIRSYNGAILMRNLFDLFVLDDIVDACRVNITHKTTENIEKQVILDKVYKTAEPLTEALLPESMLFRINTSLVKTMHISLLPDGNYRILTRWKPEDMHTFESALALVKHIVVGIIKRINSIKLAVFVELPEPKSSNSKFSEINISLYYKRALTSDGFEQLIKQVDEFTDAQIMTKVASETKTNRDYYFNMGMVQYDMGRLERGIHVSNYYEYLSEPLIKTRWDTLFMHTRLTRFLHRLTDVKIEAIGVRELEYDTFFWLLTTLFYRFENSRNFNLKKMLTSSRSFGLGDGSSPNKYISFLKSFDPALYDFKQTKIPARLRLPIYSKVCQKPYQPLIMSQLEYDKSPQSIKKRAVKYWNFTTQEPAYYLCPNARYPNIRFIVGRHPLGYCIPCCKMTESGVGLRKDIQEICLQEHIYLKERRSVVSSRYIAMYGKDIEPGRLSRLPKDSLEPLLYESTSRSTELECAVTSGYYLFGVHQKTSNANDIGYVFALADAMNTNLPDFIERIITHLRRDPHKFDIVVRGSIEFFENLESLIDAIRKLGNEKFEFDRIYPWNNIFMNIAYALLGINTIHFIDTGNDIRLAIPDGIIDADDYLSPLHKHLIILQKGRKYYPIYYLNTNTYFTMRVVETKLFSHESDVLYILKRLLIKTLEVHIKGQSGTFTLHNISRFINDNKKYEAKALYINRRDMCYVVNISGIYVPLEYSIHNTLFVDVTRKYNPPRRGELLSDFVKSRNFVKDYNSWAESINRRGNEQIHLLKFQAWLSLRPPRVRIGKIIGFIANGLHFYCKPLSQEGALRNTKAPVTTMLYDPFIINNIIYDAPKPVLVAAISDAKVMDTMYDISLYKLLLLEFITYFRKRRNISTRNAITRILSKTAEYDAIIEQFKKILKTSSDMQHLSQIVNDYFSRAFHKDTASDAKQKMFRRIKKTIFEFDMTELHDLMNITDHHLMAARLKKIASRLVSIGHPAKGAFQNIYTACQNINQPHCRKHRLAISNVRLNELLSIMTADLMNPLKKKWLFSEVVTGNIVQFFKFIRRPNETIYVSNIKIS